MLTILSNEELVRAMYQKLPEEHTPLELELLKRLDTIVSVVEQSYFRAALIEEIRDNAPVRYRKVIERMIEDSYVEL